MKRLTVSQNACTETLALLITMAWADGRLDDREKKGVRGAAEVLNLSKELRGRLEHLLSNPSEFGDLIFDTLSPREKAFAYVAGAWMANVDEALDEKERALLDQVAKAAGFNDDKKRALEAVAKSLEALPEGASGWSEQITKLFRAIPPGLEEPGGEFEVVFE